MLYVQQSLGPNEELVHVGKFHWMFTVGAFFSIFWSFLASIFVLALAVNVYAYFGKIPSNAGIYESLIIVHPLIRLGAFLVFVFGLIKFAHLMIVKATTEIAVTSNRLIYKRGLIARQVSEINVDKIEGVNVFQSILGRVFNYGRLIVRGMGVGEVLLPTIQDPISFRRAIEKAKTV